MLEASADSLALQALDVCRGEPPGEQRVLGVGLEEPAAERRAVQVDGRPEDDVDLLPLASSASISPTSRAVSSLQALASRVALGKSATWSPPVNLRPRTPVGPSEKAIGASPIEASPWRVNEVAPVSSAHLGGEVEGGDEGGEVGGHASQWSGVTRDSK